MVHIRPVCIAHPLLVAHPQWTVDPFSDLEGHLFRKDLAAVHHEAINGVALQFLLCLLNVLVRLRVPDMGGWNDVREIGESAVAVYATDIEEYGSATLAQYPMQHGPAEVRLERIVVTVWTYTESIGERLQVEVQSFTQAHVRPLRASFSSQRYQCQYVLLSVHGLFASC